jgi:hypothetical protein
LQDRIVDDSRIGKELFALYYQKSISRKLDEPEFQLFSIMTPLEIGQVTAMMFAVITTIGNDGLERFSFPIHPYSPMVVRPQSVYWIP